MTPDDCIAALIGLIQDVSRWPTDTDMFRRTNEIVGNYLATNPERRPVGGSVTKAAIMDELIGEFRERVPAADHRTSIVFEALEARQRG